MTYGENKKVNGSVTTERKDKKLIILKASTNSHPSRNEEVTRAGPFREFSTTNRFTLYQQLSLTTPHVFIPLTKLALTLVKGIRFEGKSSLIKDFEKWATRINFEERIQTLSRLLCRDGTYVAKTYNVNNPEKMYFEPLLMAETTLLPKGVVPGIMDINRILTPPIDRVYINENSTDESIRSIYKFSDVVYGAYAPRDYVMQDILGRQTYGIYGVSMLTPIEDLIYKYLDLVEGYTTYVKKYGIGRYFIDYRIIGEFLQNGDISIQEAQEILEELRNEHELIAANQDIIGTGFDIKQLDTGGSNLNVTGFKESLETDIQIGLLQAPLTMGRAEGTTYAAGYVSEADRLVVLEGLQKKIMSILNDENGIIKMRARAMKKNPDDITVVFEELSKPAVSPRDLLDGWIAGALTKAELRDGFGLPRTMPEDDSSPPRKTVITSNPRNEGNGDISNDNPVKNR